MRNNLPVTQREYDYPSDATLMSTTDTQSHITYANAAFIEVSGFARDAILGEAHNIVRHPDMPPEAFADMWATIKNRRSWTALVKNRRVNGDHYWVRANATPIVRNGQITGYMSVRTKPARHEVEATEKLYAKFRAGKANGLAFHQGLVIRTGFSQWKSLLQVASVRTRIRLGVAAFILTSVCLSSLMSTLGLGMAGTLIPLVIAGLVASFWLESQIATPLKNIQHQALQVAAGDTQEVAQLNRVDEIGMIQRAINQSGLNLRSLIADVSGQVDGVETASSEIAQGNGDLSMRTEQTASSLEQTAASMEEMTATVKTNADTAQTASDSAIHASNAAKKGGEVIRQVVETMDGITTASKKISDIISVIDGIAFQTNILALNAAVEAARAGEQGRGFAVVASEVRALAQRSAEAAKEIKTLIGNSTDKVESGSKLVSDAGEVMADIVTQVERVTDLIHQISNATREQSSGIAQVNIAVSQLDQMTQQNAALVEESAAAAESLKGQARTLNEAVEVFRSRERVADAHLLPAATRKQA